MGCKSCTSSLSVFSQQRVSECSKDQVVINLQFIHTNYSDFINKPLCIFRNRQMYFHKEIFKHADVIVTPTTGYWPRTLISHINFWNQTYCEPYCSHFHSVTAYPLQRDTFKTGELDYINGGTNLQNLKPFNCQFINDKNWI